MQYCSIARVLHVQYGLCQILLLVLLDAYTKLTALLTLFLAQGQEASPTTPITPGPKSAKIQRRLTLILKEKDNLTEEEKAALLKKVGLLLYLYVIAAPPLLHPAPPSFTPTSFFNNPLSRRS